MMRKNKPSFIKTSIVAILVGATVGLSAGAAIPYFSNKALSEINESKNFEVSTLENNGTDNVIKTLDEASQNTVDIIKKVKPSVACITSVVQGVDFFNRAYESEGSGSGIVFYKDDINAYIVTNNHVIEGASRVTISLNECDLVSAKLVGKDANKDLAVISVTLADLSAAGVKDVQVATFADSDNVKIGETVIAIGNALGRGNTATKGIISNTAKDINFSGKSLNVLQTDAAINPGNSGGALVNSSGQVVGINSAKIASTSVEGVGYSISANSAKGTIEKIMNNTDSATLGVTVATLSEEDAKKNNLPAAGVYVTEVTQGGSAYSAGIQVGDIITSFNSQPVFTSNQLVEAVQKCKIGDSVSVNIVRNGESKTIKVVMQKSKEQF
ncbi:MAG: S1C family serine protease [Lachnospirales bacterium]